jgi:hypothetical protein
MKRIAGMEFMVIDRMISGISLTRISIRERKIIKDKTTAYRPYLESITE